LASFPIRSRGNQEGSTPTKTVFALEAQPAKQKERIRHKKRIFLIEVKYKRKNHIIEIKIALSKE